MSQYSDRTVTARAIAPRYGVSVCRYILCICVCQGRYSVGTASWSVHSSCVRQSKFRVLSSVRSDPYPSVPSFPFHPEKHLFWNLHLCTQYLSRAFEFYSTNFDLNEIDNPL